ncbi:MAG: hypothetical protein GX547_12285 [Phycisphaerae bacterium]|nr:hypothetical protein [Phycisphaerae bacterium]
MTKLSSVASESVSGKRRVRKPASAGAAARAKQPVGALAQRRAAAILEVLAGVCTPPEAAGVLGISVNGYYLLERKALAGLTTACEAKPKGRVGPGPEQKLAAQQREVERLRRECLRQAALVRATQRAVGLPAAAPPKTAAKNGVTGGKRKRRRRPMVRALRAAASLRKTALASQPVNGVEQGSPEAIPAESSAQGHEASGNSSHPAPSVLS